MHAYGRRLAVATLMVGFVLWAYGSPASGQAADPVIGTWKLDAAKSTFSPGPPPKSITAKFEAAGKGIKVTVDGVGADAQPTHTEYTADYDGKDYPLVGSPVADTVSLKRIDASTIERTGKINGQVTETATWKVSPDGRTLTMTVKGKIPGGIDYDSVQVFLRE